MSFLYDITWYTRWFISQDCLIYCGFDLPNWWWIFWSGRSGIAPFDLHSQFCQCLIRTNSKQRQTCAWNKKSWIYAVFHIFPNLLKIHPEKNRPPSGAILVGKYCFIYELWLFSFFLARRRRKVWCFSLYNAISLGFPPSADFQT